MLQFDDKTARGLRKMYEAPYARERRRRIRAALAVRSGDAILDVGCGPGYVACEIAEEVGASGSVTAVDSSPTMLAVAAARAAELRFEQRIQFLEGDAARLPVDTKAFDGAVIAQVYEYVADMATALMDLHRALKPGARVVAFDTDWDSVVWHSSDAGRMQKVLKAWEEHLADPVLPRTLGSKLEAADFDVTSVDGVAMLDSDRANSGMRALADLVRDFVPGHGGVSASEARAWFDDLEQVAKRGDYFFCVTGFLFTATCR